MGGHAGGDVASSIAIGELAPLDGEAHGSDALEHLEQAIHRAHKRMHQRVDEDPELSGMGTTITALLRSGDRLALAHIGDSRAYVLSGDKFTQVTRDHTFVQWLIDQGRITPEEADVHPQRSVVMRVLGDVDADDEIDSSVREAKVGDRWLLCSDGLSGFVSDETLERTLSDAETPDDCADQLIQLALRAGGQDNITCIVADVVDASSAPGTTPQVVGAAAANRKRTSVAEGSPAAKAAALERAADQSPDDEDDDTHDERPRSRTLGATVAGIGILAVLVAAALFGYRWSQQQFFVGADAQDVAIYRGLSQDVGPVKLSRLYEKQDIPLDTLPSVWRDRVSSGIPADDLGHARQIVNTLLQRSTLCEAVEPTPAPTAAPTATPTPAPPTPAPTGAGTAAAAPTATPGVSPSGSAAATTPAPAPSAPFPTPIPTNSRGQVLPAGCSG